MIARNNKSIRSFQILLVIAIGAAWEILPRVLIPPLFVPPLSEALRALIEGGGEYLQNLPTTFGEILISYALACGGGVGFGLVIGSAPVLRRILLPLIRSAYAVPLVVLYPVIMVWFGLGATSKIAFASMYAFIPTLLTVVAGIAAINPALQLCARAYGATRAQQVLYISLPASLPSILAALRLGGALVIIGVIVSEMLGSMNGLGFLITRYRTLLDSGGVYAGIILVLTLTGLHEVLLRRLERRVAAFREA